MPDRIPGSLIEAQTVDERVLKTTTAIPRAYVSQETLSPFAISPDVWRVHDAFATNLPGTPANDDLGLVDGTFGTNVVTIQAGDLKAAGATTRYAKARLSLPHEYVAGETVTFRLRSGMETTVADTSCTLDFEAYRVDDDGTVDGADLCTTSAQNINSLSEANFDFTLTPTNLSAGDEIEVRIAITCTDAATGTAVTPVIYAATLLCDTKG